MLSVHSPQLSWLLFVTFQLTSDVITRQENVRKFQWNDEFICYHLLDKIITVSLWYTETPRNARSTLKYQKIAMSI